MCEPFDQYIKGTIAILENFAFRNDNLFIKETATDLATLKSSTASSASC